MSIKKNTVRAYFNISIFNCKFFPVKILTYQGYQTTSKYTLAYNDFLNSSQRIITKTPKSPDVTHLPSPSTYKSHYSQLHKSLKNKPSSINQKPNSLPSPISPLSLPYTSSTHPLQPTSTPSHTSLSTL